MGTVVVWALAVLGVVLLIVVRREIARSWQPGQRLAAFAATVLVAGGVLAETTVVGSPALARQLTALMFIALMVIGSLVSSTPVIPRLKRRVAPVLWALAFWGWLFIVNAIETFDESPATVLARSVSGLLLIAFLFAQTRIPLRAHHFTAAALLTVGVLLATLPLVSRPLGNCTIFKCSEIGLILLGPFSSGNYFGIQLAMTAALAMTTIASVRIRVFVLATMFIALYATNSRTSMFALAAGIVVYLVIATFNSRRSQSETTRRGLSPLILLTATIVPAVGLALVLTSDASAFSNRGHIWNLGVNAVGSNGLTGVGLDMWGELQRVGVVSYLFTHSEYMLLYFSGGLVAIVLFAVWIASAASAGRISQPIARVLVLPLIFTMLGVLEVVWNPLTVDGLTWHAIAICCLAMPAVVQRADRERQHAFQRDHVVSS